MFAEDLGLQFTSLAQEAWKLVLLFILTELKRGFTRCLKEKAGIPVQPVDVDAAASSNLASISLSVFGLPYNNFSTITDSRRDVSNHVSDNVVDDDAADADRNDVTHVDNNAKCCSSQTETKKDDE